MVKSSLSVPAVREEIMSKTYNIVVMGGDYSGPEVMAEAIKVLDVVQKLRPDIILKLQHHLVGGASLDVHGEPLTEEALLASKKADAVLFGAVGGPKWGISAHPPERGLGILRKELQAYGNLRPVFFISASLVAVSPLKPEICRDADLMIIRELNGGIYYGSREEPNANLDVASDLDLYTRGEVERITRLAGALAMSHDPPLKVTSLDKANLLAAAGRLWRGVVSETLAREFPLVQLKHLLIDSAAMVMVKNPSSLNGIILTSNMFGDIISDEASVIPGSLGLMPSASLCGVPSPDANTRVRGLYEPIHGSAPDIAGKGIVNPVGMILSVAMMLRYSLCMPEEAKFIELAVRAVIDSGICTPDINGSATTREFGDAVAKELLNQGEK